MSWFKELTSKAEALLVKLDQDAAQALQNPEELLPGFKHNDQDYTSSFDQESANNHLESSNISELVQRQPEVVPKSNVEQTLSTPHRHLDVVRDVSTSIQSQIVDTTTSSRPDQIASTTLLQDESPISRNVIRVEEQTSTDTSPLLNDNHKEEFNINSVATKETLNNIPNYSKKFTIQTSKTGSRLFVPSTSKRRDIVTKTNGIERRETPIDNLGADDIRASINRSLQEYTYHSSTLTTLKRERSYNSTHNSYFDNQPNLVEQTNYSNTDETLLNRSSSSASFSIDVPDDRPIDGKSGSNDIAARLLKKSMSKRKKSTFYLHQVINRLANPSEPSTPIFSDQTRIRLKRAQMRLASSMRRLNYYLQAYPMVKYLILIQLVMMQLLVIYVLFFYQSSGSASELSSQIKKQQQELSESQ